MGTTLTDDQLRALFKSARQQLPLTMPMSVAIDRVAADLLAQSLLAATPEAKKRYGELAARARQMAELARKDEHDAQH